MASTNAPAAGDSPPPSPFASPDSPRPDSSEDVSDLESLSAKACALLKPVPDYADAISRSNARSKKKYGDRFTIGDDEDMADVADDEELKALDNDTSGIVLAERTSQILSNFQDYVSGIGGAAGDAKKEILAASGVGPGGDPPAAAEGEPTFLTDDPANRASVQNMASALRGDAKAGLLADPTKPLQREWAYDGYHPSGSADELHHKHQTNLHDVGSNMGSLEEWEDVEGGRLMLPRGQKYTHPWLQSRRIRRGICSIAVLAVIIGLSVGITKNKNSQAGEELEAKINDVEEELAQGKDTGIAASDKPHGDVPYVIVPTGIPKPPSGVSAADQRVYEEQLDKYRPQVFGRSDGWNGKTYLDAYQFCSLRPPAPDLPGAYGVCPYQAVCPLGPDRPPLGGYQDSEGGTSWLPISDAANDWIALDPSNSCLKWSYSHEYPPEWGLTGAWDAGSAGADVTARVMCCLGLGGTFEGMEELAEGTPEGVEYKRAEEKYQPVEFDRSKGWNGRTYVEGLQFCGSMEGYELCPYSAICPLGPDSTPLGGIKMKKKGTWIPILDSANDWVQVGPEGPEGPCVKYSNAHGNPPAWSVTGAGSEEMTRHLICCLFDADAAAVLEEAAAEEAAAEAKTDEAAGLNLPPGAETPGDAAIQAYQSTTAQFLPISFNREKGWNGHTYGQADYYCKESAPTGYSICPYEAICPLGANTEPLGGYKLPGPGGEQWMPISGQINDWVQVAESAGPCIRYSSNHPDLPDWGITGRDSEGFTTHVMCCLESEQEASAEEEQDKFTEQMIYKEAAQDFMPVEFDREEGWGGRTFQAAVEFCEENGKMSLCPYEAICPMGVDESPLGGYRDEPTWVPVLDIDKGPNWVQVSHDNACVLWLAEHDKLPDWSLTGDGNEEITRRVVCCGDYSGGGQLPAQVATIVQEKEEEEVDADQEEAFAYVASLYDPIWFDRSSNWKGQTYEEALAFCASTKHDGKALMLCPYQAYCPMGPDGAIYGGMWEEPRGSWAPIINDDNAWISIGHENTCKFYSQFTEGAHPEWGLTGEDDEDLTRHIMCCSSEQTTEESINGIPVVPSVTGGEEGQEDSAFSYVLGLFNPQWYDRSSGWMGQDYDAALAFCANTKRDGKQLMLCPYQAYCPLGPEGDLYGGIWEEPSGSWAPIVNDANHWISIGHDNTCSFYSEFTEGQNPEWGLTGENDEDLTRHIMCCAMQEGQGESIIESILGGPDSPVHIDEAPSVDEVKAEIENAFNTAMAKYAPIIYNRSDGWSGTTYKEAIQHCASKEGYNVCPYHAICPMGDNGPPLSGDNGQTVSWAAMSDIENEWVSVGSENTCKTYSKTQGSPPDWGLTGEGNEAITRNLLCCKGSVFGGAQEAFMYEDAAKTFHLDWSDRDSGWTGQSWKDSFDFCSAKGMELCPYEAICPLAEYDVPIGGVRDDENAFGSWVALSRVTNGWVSVSSQNTCKIYGVVYGVAPEWGLTGEGAEPITRNIACCDPKAAAASKPAPTPPATKPTPPATPKPTLPPTPKPVTPVTPEPVTPITPKPVTTPPPTLPPTPKPVTPSPTPNPTPKPVTPLPTPRPTPKPVGGAIGEAAEAYKTAEMYNPQWYDRSSGWTGQTYDQAFEFCSSKGSNHDVCPYEVICPSGPLSMPYGGSRPERGAWAPLNEPFNSWVEVGDPQVCVKYENLNPEDHPSWGLTGIDDEYLTRNVLCCEMKNSPAEESPGEGGASEAYGSVVETYAPKWFDRSEGWDGRSYTDALSFCASKDSYIPCPYEAYCPLGEGSLPTGGYDGTEEAWAPIIDAPNAWVQIGSFQKEGISNSCMQYTALNDVPPAWGITGESAEDLTPHVMCCREPDSHSIKGMDAPPEPYTMAIAESKAEQDVLEDMNPVWFGKKHGYKGTTYQHAEEFCEAIGDMVLCPRAAYCPGNKLFLQREPFPGQQWAPTAKAMGSSGDTWISVGTSHDVCTTHDEMQLSLPQWASDGSQPEMKDYVLCCQNPGYLAKEVSLKNQLNPIWMDDSHGWKGGSHDDAIKFCESFGNRKLCPYSAYCPHGPGQPPMGGHAADFNAEGELWSPLYSAPVAGEMNHWVQIGRKYQNRATTCMDNQQLEGEAPSWGLTNENANVKKYLLCCSF